MNDMTAPIMIGSGVAKAVAASIQEVGILGKKDRNNHASYNFASIDKFLEMVNPICAKNKLFPLISCDHIDYYEVQNRNGTAMWGRYHFQIQIVHESGEALPPQAITVPIQISGSQASGAAQSYALKQFYRGLMMIPTGDKDDPDFNKPLDENESVANSISSDQANHLEAEIKRVGANHAKFLNHFEIDAILSLNLSDYDEAVNLLKAREKRNDLEEVL